MADILFYSTKTRFKLKNQQKVKSWLLAICRKEKCQVEELSYVFCSDAYLLSLNKKYLHHSTLTDILSFSLGNGARIQGEIYISIPRVKENARNFDQPFDRELRRVIAHGLLHFVGYQDKTRAEKAQMRLKEEACLSLWR